MNIAMAIYSMQAGGTERVVSILADAWVRKGHIVSVFTFDNKRSDSFYVLPAAIEFSKFGISGGASRPSSLIKKYSSFRKHLRHRPYDVLVSFTSEMNVLILAATMGLQIPAVVSERSDPKIIPKPTLWRILRAMFYKRLPAAIFVQSEYAAGYFESRVSARIVAIPNPIVVHRAQDTSAERRDTALRIINVGRLVKEKRQDLLLDAARRVLESNSDLDIQIRIVGEGPMQAALEEAASRLGIEGNVRICRFSDDPWKGVNHGDIYVQCSDFEGFPNALCEAMTRGCAVISTFYSPAVREIVRDQVNGLLIPPNDASELFAALDSMVKSPTRRRIYGTEARKISSDLDPERVSERWIKELEQVIH